MNIVTPNQTNNVRVLTNTCNELSEEDKPLKSRKCCSEWCQIKKWKFHQACVLLSELIVSACATAFASSAAICMPPVPIVTMSAAWTFMHPNTISFIAPAVRSDISRESVFLADFNSNFLLWIIFWIDGVRSWIFVTQRLRAFFHASIPRFRFVVCLAIVDAVVSCVALVASNSTHAFLLPAKPVFAVVWRATWASTGEFVVSTLATSRCCVTSADLCFRLTSNCQLFQSLNERLISSP